MSQGAMGLKPVQVASMPMLNMVAVAESEERQMFKHDMAVLVNLTEMKGEVNCGDGKATNYWGTEQRCGDTRKCYVCSGRNNVRRSKTYVCEDVKSAAAGLDQVVRSMTDLVMVGAAQAMYGYLKDNPDQRKALSHFGAVRVTRQRAMKMMERKVSPNTV